MDAWLAWRSYNVQPRADGQLRCRSAHAGCSPQRSPLLDAHHATLPPLGLWACGPMRAAAAAAALLVVTGTVLVCAAVLQTLYGLPRNLCNEGQEEPSYEPVHLGPEFVASRLPSYYRLLRVVEGGGSNEGARQQPRASTVLFVPGNAGAFTQAKSFAAEAAKAALPLAFFTADLGSELVAFRGELLYRQASFIRLCLARLRNGTALGGRGPWVVAVGHSMGGVVLRAALQTSYLEGVAFGPRTGGVLLTLGTPHIAPVVATEPSLAIFYSELNSRWGGSQTGGTSSGSGGIELLVAVAGGERDTQVPAHLSNLPSNSAIRPISLAAQNIRGVNGSVDHQCLSWCLPLVHRLNDLLAASCNASNTRLQTRIGSMSGLPAQVTKIVWQPPPLAWPNVTLNPARLLRGAEPVALPFTVSTESAPPRLEPGCHITLRQQWLALPQRLTIRCEGEDVQTRLFERSDDALLRYAST
jgi:hypothetical protein